MDDCCSKKGDELEALVRGDRRRVLQLVLLINLVMFMVEFGAGIVARSTALMADSVDMLGDALVYGVSLFALSRDERFKAGAALFKAAAILVFGLWIVADVAMKLSSGVVPTSELMGGFGALALVANLTCLMLLWRHRHADVNMSSTFQCSRNDVISNLGVLLAAAGVWWTGQAWPDILIGSLVALLFLRSSVAVAREAWPQYRAATRAARVRSAAR